MTDTILCSVLLPTRMRVAKLQRAVKSIFATADDPKRIEVVLRLHADDLDTIELIPVLLRMGNVRVAIGPRVKYEHLATCFNEAASLATGLWHMQFGDDCVLEGKGWDSKLDELDVTDQGMMVQPETHKLGISTYHHDVQCPFMFYPWWVWENVFERSLPNPADKCVWNWANNTATFLSGISVWHDRDEADCNRIA